jgi:subtilisin-like proprotein convertase family protein
MRRTLLLLTTMTIALLVASGVALAATFRNTDGITINDSLITSPPNIATPYPSEITVSGLSGTVTDVNLKLGGLRHTEPPDIDVLLVGPSGANAIVMSDVGGLDPVRKLHLLLDDEAASSLPNGSPLTGGTFQPTNHLGSDGSNESWPSPAPSSSGGSALSVFDGTDPNGTWKLYVVDDAQVDSGRLRRWALRISTATT